MKFQSSNTISSFDSETVNSMEISLHFQIQVLFEQDYTLASTLNMLNSFWFMVIFRQCWQIYHSHLWEPYCVDKVQFVSEYWNNQFQVMLTSCPCRSCSRFQNFNVWSFCLIHIYFLSHVSLVLHEITQAVLKTQNCTMHHVAHSRFSCLTLDKAWRVASVNMLRWTWKANKDNIMF